ncbi:MAG: tetratricopeptide repeat protein [Dehalococcoidia bacterium]
MDPLTALYVAAALVTIGTPLYFLIRRARRQREKADTATDAVKQAVEEATRPLKTELERISEYIDGLTGELFDKAYALYREYKYPQAIEAFQACFHPATTTSERTALHILIGNCFLSLSELEEAEGHYREAETAARQAKDNEGLAAALGNIGIIYRIKGELDKALEIFEQVLKTERKIGRRWGEANALGSIGLVYQTKGELDKALDYYQQSLKINREIGRKEGEASVMGNIGIVYSIKGELDKALDYHQQSLKINREIGRKEGEAYQLNNIGGIYWAKGEPDRALEYAQQALKIFEEIGAKIEIVETKANIQMAKARKEQK